MQVELYTKEYTIVGAVITRHERLKDLLENYFHRFLPVKRASIVPLHHRARANSEKVEGVLVRLDEVVLATPRDDILETERDRSSHPEYVSKYPVQAAMHLHLMVIKGQVFVREGEEAESAMMASRERFVVVKGAQVSYPYDDRLPSFAAEVVIVNRDHIQLLHSSAAG